MVIWLFVDFQIYEIANKSNGQINNNPREWNIHDNSLNAHKYNFPMNVPSVPLKIKIDRWNQKTTLIPPNKSK